MTSPLPNHTLLMGDEFEPATKRLLTLLAVASPALSPMKMLAEPDTLTDPAKAPIAVLLPEVESTRALLPTAVHDAALTIALRALSPIAVMSLPLVVAVQAWEPTAVLELIVVTFNAS